MKKTVKDLIQQLEKMNPDETIFYLVYTKQDVKELEHFDPITGQVVYPYNDDLAESILINLDCYDSIYEQVYNCMSEEASYQVDQLAKKENIHTPEPASY